MKKIYIYWVLAIALIIGAFMDLNNNPKPAKKDPPVTPTTEIKEPVISITKSKQEKKIGIYYFGATWCSPCVAMKKHFKEKDVKNLLDKSDFRLYDIDRHGNLAKKYGIQFVPTLVFIDNDKVVEKISGYQSKEKLIKLLEKYLS